MRGPHAQALANAAGEICPGLFPKSDTERMPTTIPATSTRKAALAPATLTGTGLSESNVRSSSVYTTLGKAWLVELTWFPSLPAASGWPRFGIRGSWVEALHGSPWAMSERYLGTLATHSATYSLFHAVAL